MTELILKYLTLNLQIKWSLIQNMMPRVESFESIKHKTEI